MTPFKINLHFSPSFLANQDRKATKMPHNEWVEKMPDVRNILSSNQNGHVKRQ